MEVHIKIHPTCCLGCLNTVLLLFEKEINSGDWEGMKFEVLSIVSSTLGVRSKLPVWFLCVRRKLSNIRQNTPEIFTVAFFTLFIKECSFCEDPRFARTGVCISCDAGMCRAYFHVTCAQKEGLLSEAAAEEVAMDRIRVVLKGCGDGLKLCLFCSRSLNKVFVNQ